MINPTRSTPARLGVALALGAATLGVAACGNSTSSTPSTSSTTSVTTSTTTSSPTTSATGSSSAAPTSNGKAFTATQLDQAVAATVIDGKKITTMKQADLKNIRDLMAETTKHMQNVTITPAECRAAVNLGQVGAQTNASAPMSIGEDSSNTVTLAATQLSAGSTDTFNTDLLQKCGHMTMKGSLDGIQVDETVTMTPFDVTSSQASDVHGLVQTTVNRGKSTTTSIALGRVGDVAVEATRTGNASAQQLSSDLDALATQIKKLG